MNSQPEEPDLAGVGIDVRLRAVYTSELATDYSPFSSMLRYASVWAFRPLVDRVSGGYNVLDIGCGLAGFATYSRCNAMPMSRYYGIEARPELLVAAQAALSGDDTASNFPPEGKFDIILGLGLVSYQLTDDVTRDWGYYLALLRRLCSLRANEASRIYITLRTDKGRLDSSGSRYLTGDPDWLASALSLRIVRVLRLFESEDLLVLT
jgi:hypothetical protein